MIDVSNWLFTGYGENSTLEKIELLSPDDEPYVLKFPREFDGTRTNWEDVNEIVAANIAEFLSLPAVDAQIAYRDGKRGCLMKHFRYELNADYGETVASLLSSEFEGSYDSLHDSSYPNAERMEKFISLFESFSLFPKLKELFIHMNLFDILIGNQDRHAHNWQVLYKKGEAFGAPLYDNGASLGWQLPDKDLARMLKSEKLMNKYFKKTSLKIGLDNREIPKIKSTTFLNYIRSHYNGECESFLKRLRELPLREAETYINAFPLISATRKQFLLQNIRFRRNKLIEFLKEGG